MSQKIQCGIAWLAIYLTISIIIFGMLSGLTPFLVSLGIAMILSGVITYLVFTAIVDPFIHQMTQTPQEESLETDELFSGALYKSDGLPRGFTIRYENSTQEPTVTHPNQITRIRLGGGLVTIDSDRNTSVSVSDPNLRVSVTDSITGNHQSIGF